jgi:uncharacterized protein YbjQ (UPF0145 family)
VSHVSYLHRQGEPWMCVWCDAANLGFTNQNDPAAAVVSDLTTDMARMARDGLLPEHLRPPEQMLIVTTNEIPGYRIIRVHGDVFGLTVRAPAPFSGFAAGVRAAFGDAEMAGYTDLLIDSRNQARVRMWAEARARGANAIIGMRFDCSEIAGNFSEVAAYGTAVTAEETRQAS